MKECKNEISKDCVKVSSFRGLRGGMLLMFGLASLYLLFAEKKVTDGNESDNRMADKEIVAPYAPNVTDNYGMEVVTRSYRDSEMNQETNENKAVSFNYTGIEGVSIPGINMNRGNFMNTVSKRSAMNCFLYCPVGDNMLTDKKVLSLNDIASNNILSLSKYAQYNIIPLGCEPEGTFLLDSGCIPFPNGITFMGYRKGM